MDVTLDVSHASSGWLKMVAPANVCSKVATRDTFQSARGWLYAVALAKVRAKDVTRLVSQSDKSSSKSSKANHIVVLVELVVLNVSSKS